MLLVGEIEKQQTLVKIKDEEIFSWKEKYFNMEKRWIEDSRSTLSNAAFEENISKLTRDNDRLNFLLREKELKTEDYEQKIRLLSEEINRLSNLLCDRNMEMENLKIQISEVETSTLLASARKEDRFQTASRVGEKIYSDLEELRTKFSLEQARVLDLEDKVALLANENSKNKINNIFIYNLLIFQENNKNKENNTFRINLN